MRRGSVAPGGNNTEGRVERLWDNVNGTTQKSKKNEGTDYTQKKLHSSTFSYIFIFFIKVSNGDN